MKQFYRFVLVSSILALFSCDKEELKAPIPGYLTIEDVRVNTTLEAEGSASDNITDVIVFLNDQSLGFFDLPASIPIQQTGAVNLKIRGVIPVNGQSSKIVQYPFYTTFELDTIFVPEEEIVLAPVVEYFKTIDFTEPWSGEDFESGINFIYNPKSDTTFVRETNSSNVFEGRASGRGSLTAEQTLFEAWTPTFSNIPRNGTAVYLELDYKSTHDFVVGVYANDQSFESAIVFFRPQSEWKKVYVDLGNVFSTLSTARNYNISFGYQKPLGSSGDLFIDNVKILHY
ncbi:MAG: hypothetical protein RJQ00_08080 [Vicingaceae bacterium]